MRSKEKAFLKCKLCGEISMFDDDGCSRFDGSRTNVYATYPGYHYRYKYIVPDVLVHECSDGRLGIFDLIGFEKE